MATLASCGSHSPPGYSIYTGWHIIFTSHLRQYTQEHGASHTHQLEYRGSTTVQNPSPPRQAISSQLQEGFLAAGHLLRGCFDLILNLNLTLNQSKTRKDIYTGTLRHLLDAVTGHSMNRLRATNRSMSNPNRLERSKNVNSNLRPTACAHASTCVIALTVSPTNTPKKHLLDPPRVLRFSCRDQPLSSPPSLAIGAPKGRSYFTALTNVRLVGGGGKYIHLPPILHSLGSTTDVCREILVESTLLKRMKRRGN